MSGQGNLLILLTEKLQPACRSIPEARSLVDQCASEDVRALHSRVTARNYSSDAHSLVCTNFILRTEDSQEVLGYDFTSVAVDCFLSVCQINRLNPNDYLSHLISLLTRELLSTDDIDQVFKYGKLALKLRGEGIDITVIENALDIAYSPLVFELALGTDKDKIQEALKALIRAKELNLDSTGAEHAIVENALSWVEDNEDFYNVKGNSGQRVDPDRNGTQIMLGLMMSLKPGEDEFRERLDTLKAKYGSIEVVNLYCSDSYQTEAAELSSEPFQGEIQSRDMIEIIGESFKQSHTDDKSIETRLYRARIKANNQEICVKKITANDKQLLSKFHHEVNILRQLSDRHECFLTFYGSYIIENELFILMEYIQDTLMDKLTRGGLTELQMIEIAKTLISGFSTLAQQKIYHRDIKPHNILLTLTNVPKIIDFGITVFDLNPSLSSVTSMATNSRFIQGTRGYMSPEQKLAFVQYNKDRTVLKYGLLKSDVFSLGITLFQMVTGEDVSKYEDSSTNKDLRAKVHSLSSQKLKSIIIEMIDENPDNRKSFVELAAMSEGTTMTIIN